MLKIVNNCLALSVRYDSQGNREWLDITGEVVLIKYEAYGCWKSRQFSSDSWKEHGTESAALDSFLDVLKIHNNSFVGID